MTAPAEQTEEQTAPQEGEEQTAEELSPDVLRKQLEKARKEAANYRTKVRELEPLASKAKELEEAQKTESQKLAERAEAAERTASEAQRELARFRVLSEVALPPELHEFVVGNDEDELRAKAQKLKAQFSADAQSVDVGQGPRGTSAAPSMSALIRQAAGRA